MQPFRSKHLHKFQFIYFMKVEFAIIFIELNSTLVWVVIFSETCHTTMEREFLRLQGTNYKSLHNLELYTTRYEYFWWFPFHFRYISVTFSATILNTSQYIFEAKVDKPHPM